MRILLGQDRVVFEPENEHDRAVLKKLHSGGIKEMRFDDMWYQTGNLSIIFRSSSYGEPNSGYGSDEMGGR